MNTNLTREQISAFVDNELSDAHVDVALAALHKEDGRDTWNLYHQIGDALRSDDLNVHVSEGFNARMFARLDAEPTIMAPAAPAQKSYRRFAMPGMAAAAVAVLAVLTVPKIMMHEQPAAVANVTQVAAAAPDTVTVASENGEVLRDPRIDDYLLAHQRFSPSVYSTAQYARSATFAVETDK
ncbi:MAG TPA: sigma-E factor negative regulatory protein [Oxalicibacterium sp.]|jgi:sigma-E factor negative regulatory protein RseA|nr:sigma-E factor negative regulatory protein [Oxalicibacterium sp.]